MAPAIILLLCLQSVKPCFTKALAVRRIAANCFLNVSSYVNVTFYVLLIFKSFNLMKDFNYWTAAKVDLVTTLREIFFIFFFILGRMMPSIMYYLVCNLPPVKTSHLPGVTSCHPHMQPSICRENGFTADYVKKKSCF